MNIEEIRKSRFIIVLEALNEGMDIQYKNGWSIFLNESVLYQTTISEHFQKRIYHKSGITVTEFLLFITNLDDVTLKTLYGNIRLLRLQKKLQSGQNEQQENQEEE